MSGPWKATEQAMTLPCDGCEHQRGCKIVCQAFRVYELNYQTGKKWTPEMRGRAMPKRVYSKRPKKRTGDFVNPFKRVDRWGTYA